MHDLRERPIPNLDAVRERRRGTRSYPIDLDSIEETEHARDLLAEGFAGANYYYRTDNPPYFHRAPGAIPQLYVREGLVWRLIKANKMFHQYGCELYIYDAYRPPEVQNHFHDVWVPEYLRKLHPDWSEEKIRDEVGNYWAKGVPDIHAVDPQSPPPHMTGGVVDITLKELFSDEHLPMGTDFDVVHESAFTEYLENLSGLRELTREESLALRNRRLLYWVMHEVGMANNPNEWWHYSYGDQMWAKISEAPIALYGAMKLPNMKAV